MELLDIKYFYKMADPVRYMVQVMRDPVRFGNQHDHQASVYLDSGQFIKVNIHGEYNRPVMDKITVQCRCMIPVSETGKNLLSTMGTFPVEINRFDCQYDDRVIATMIENLYTRYRLMVEGYQTGQQFIRNTTVSPIADEETPPTTQIEPDRGYLTTEIITRILYNMLVHKLAYHSNLHWTKISDVEKDRIHKLVKTFYQFPMDSMNPFQDDKRWQGGVVYLYKDNHATSYYADYDPASGWFRHTLILTETNVVNTTSYVDKGFSSVNYMICIITPVPSEIYKIGDDKINEYAEGRVVSESEQRDHKLMTKWLDVLTEKLNEYIYLLDKIRTPTSEDVVISIPWFNADAHPYII